MFADRPFRDEVRLSAVNSINWARIAAQIPYYVAAALALGAPDREVAFSVPTGNFGNVLAAWAARRMGLPVARLIVGSNRNDILARFLASNDMSMAPVEPSLSPSMDIQISSNFERLLFELLDRDCDATREHDAPVSRHSAACTSPTRSGTAPAACSTASAWTTPAPRPRSAACTLPPATSPTRTPPSASPPPEPSLRGGVPIVAMATAHPAKFPDAMERATGRRPALPPRMADLFDREEKFTVLPNDLPTIESAVRALVGRNR